MKFRDQLAILDACNESWEWVGNKTIEQAWKTCKNSQWMLWVLTKTDLDLIDPLCDIAERVFHLVPEEHKLVCSNAISAARRRASKDELDAAADAAIAIAEAYYAPNASCTDAAVHDAAYAAYSAAKAAGYAAYYASGSDDYYAGCVSDVATSAAYYAAYAAVSSSDFTRANNAYKKEQKKQCDILRKYFTIDQVKEAFNKLIA